MGIVVQQDLTSQAFTADLKKLYLVSQNCTDSLVA